VNKKKLNFLKAEIWDDTNKSNPTINKKKNLTTDIEKQLKPKNQDEKKNT